MAYNKTEWIANQTLVSANNLNKIEQGIEEAHKKIDGAIDVDEVEQKVQEAIEEAKEYADTKVAELVDSAPDTLNTLKELGDALGNDANFASTVTRQIGEKLGKTENAASATKLQTARKIKLDGAVTGEVSFDGSKDATVNVRRKNCVCGFSGSNSTTEKYFKVASLKAKYTHHYTSITFLVDDTFGIKSGILKLGVAYISEHDPFFSTNILWESNAGFNENNFILAYKKDEDGLAIFELWLKSKEVSFRFVVMDEGEKSSTNNDAWVLYNSLTPQDSLPEGYQIKVSSIATLKNNISGKAPETLKDAKAYVDERLAALTQLLVTRGILEEELVTIPELEGDVETEE